MGRLVLVESPFWGAVALFGFVLAGCCFRRWLFALIPELSGGSSQSAVKSKSWRQGTDQHEINIYSRDFRIHQR